MQNDSSLASTADIRQILIKSFRDEELTALCFDYFPDVYDTFAAGTTKEHKVQLLIEHCVRRELVPNLLAAIRRAQAEQHPARFPSARPEPSRRERDPGQIFISHAHEDAGFAHRLANDLNKNGWRVWIAPESIRPGEKWVEAVNRGLDESGVFMLVLTPKAVQSRWVKDETNVAIECEHEGQLRFIPLGVEQCSIPPLWRAYQRTSFLGRYQDGLTSLLKELGATDAFGTADKRIPPSPPLPVIPPAAQVSAEPTSTPRSARPPSAYPLKNPLPLFLAGAGVVILALVVVLICRILAATPTPYAPYPTVQPTTESAPVATRVSDKDGMAMVYVPAGEFLMGSMDADSQASSDEKPQHKVYLDAFWIDRTEVTNAQYNECVQTGACTASRYAGDSSFNAYNQPVGGVSWSEAQAYCQWAGRQLPTEAQWEKAARGTDGRIYPWGNQAATCDYAVMNVGNGNGCSRGAAWPVGSKPKGASPYGALDMAGNVYEWVADWYDDKYYADSPYRNPPGPSSGTARVSRGGSLDRDAQVMRGTCRNGLPPDLWSLALGFRCALNVWQ